MFTALLIAALAQDKTTVEDVLKLMEKNTAALQDLTFEVTTGGQGAELGEELSVTATWKRGAGLRLRVVSHPRKKKGGGFPIAIGGFEFAYAPDGFYLWSGTGQAGRPLAVVNQRMPWDSAAAKSFDPYFLPTGFPIRLFIDDAFVYYELDPRFFMGREQNLSYEGKRVEGDKSYHVLSSYLSPSELYDKLDGAEILFTSSRKEFHVAADTGHLARLRWEVTVKQAMMGESREEKGTLVATAGPRAELAGGATLVSATTWVFIDESRGRGQSDQQMVHGFKGFRANTGVAAEAILTEAERKDLHADATLLKPEEYEAALRKDPKNTQARYSRALARGTPSMMEQMMGGMGPAGGKKEEVKILDDLEKVVAERPDAESAVLNLLAAADAEGAAERAKPVLAKIEEGVIAGDRVRVEAAAQLNTKGEFDRALRLLEKDPAGESMRRRAAVERIFALSAKRDGPGAVQAMAAESARRPATSDKVGLVREMESRLAGLPKDAALEGDKLVADALEKSPGDLVLRLELARRRATVESAAALLEAAPGDEAAVDFALEILADRTEFKKEDADRLRAVFAKVTVPDPRAPFQLGRALKASGSAEEAKKEFGAALEKCAAMPKGAAAYVGGLLFELSAEEGPGTADEWLEKVVAAIVKVAPDGGGAPPEMRWDGGKNPVNRLARSHIDAKRWREFHKLATAVGTRLIVEWDISQKLQGDLRKECAQAVREDLLKSASDPAPHKDYARFARRFLGGEGALEVLEKARELAPKDVEVLWMLAEAAGQANERERALAALEAALPLLEKPAIVDGRSVTRADALVEMAEKHTDAAKVKEILGKVDLKAAGLPGSTIETIGDPYARVEEWALAAGAYLRAKELGLKPNFKLGRCLEKQKDYYEALRWYNRDIAEGSSRSVMGEQVDVAPPAPVPVVPGEEAPPQPPKEREPVNGTEARERLLKQLGPDWLTKKFLEQKFEPLTAEDQKRLKRAVELFRSEDMGERDAGEADVRKIGPRATPMLKELLEAKDEEVRTRVRGLLGGWAEPR